MDSSTSPTVLGIDPGTRFLGIAAICERDLRDFSVHEIRNGANPYKLIGQARQVVLRSIAQFSPDVVAIEAPYLVATKRGAVLSAIAQELYERSRELGIRVLEIPPEEVRRRITRNPRATKIEVAEALIETGLSQLQEYVPKRPAKSALGLRPRDRYWLHAFDALALAVATGTSAPTNTF